MINDYHKIINILYTMGVYIANIKISSAQSTVNKLRKKRSKKKQKYRMKKYIIDEYKTYMTFEADLIIV